MSYPGNGIRDPNATLYANQSGTQSADSAVLTSMDQNLAAGQQTVTYAGADGSRKKGKTTYWDRTRQGYRDSYNAQRDANNRARQRAQQRARQATAAQIDALNRGYQGTNRQLYRDYMQQQRNLPQQMAAQGYTGGLTESSRLRLGNAYEEALNTNEQTRLGQEADINESLNQRLYEAQATADAANAEARQRYYDQVAQMREQRRQEEREDLEKRAAAMAATGDFSLYKKLGYTDAQIRRLRREWERNRKKEKTAGSRGGGRRGGTGSKKGSGFNDFNNQGMTRPENPNHDNSENGNYQRWQEYMRQRQGTGGQGGR